MSNLFESANYPTCEPNFLYIGARWAWRRPELSNTYDPELFDLVYRFVNLETDQVVDNIQASVSDDNEFVIEVSSATTTEETYPPASWQWFASIVRKSDSESIVAGDGFLDILPVGVGVMGHVKRVLDAIRKTIEKTAGQGSANYSVDGQSLTRKTYEELKAMEVEYSRRWNDLVQQRNRENGRADRNRVRITMQGG